MTPEEEEAQRRNQAAAGPNAGVNVAQTQTAAGGIAGMFDMKDPGAQYTAANVDNPGADASKAAIAAHLADVEHRQKESMNPTMAGATTVNMAPANADRFDANTTRGAQQQFAEQMAEAASGRGGPSAAQSTLQAGTDAAIASNLALARSQRGGNQSVALKSALQQNGLQTQHAATDAATLRAQEQQQAEGLYANTLSGVRGQDLQTQSQDVGAATAAAQIEQQTKLANAGIANDASKTNLASHIQQQQQIDELTKQYIGMGMTADQAAQQAQIQQRQFNAGLLAQQEAARNGISAQNNASAMQTGAAAAQAAGVALAAALA